MSYKIGYLLKKVGIIDDNIVDSILKIQKQTKERFGNILVKNNLLDKDFLEDILKNINQKKIFRKKLGEILVGLKFIEEKLINKALEIQKTNNKRLGEILLSENLISKEKLFKALKIQKKLFLISISSIFVASCGSPRVPLQSPIGTIQSYNYSPVLKTLKDSGLGKVNYYKDGSIVIEGVPFFQQGRDNTCGQAVMASILNFWGINISYQQIVNETNPGNGPTDVSKITSYLRRQGLNAQDYRLATLNFVKDRIQKGQPVIMLLDFGSLQTVHYVIAVGYNDETQEMIFHDSVDGPFVRLSYVQVEQLWENLSMRKLGIFGDKYKRIAFDVSGNLLL
ncbi:MAG: hypothetical protein KatS3mg068_1955 [Candidatus Sericytochromatia bacterium]|nr:MAG: hypothetical protein KatS3mg068_1955 [Candidatus Sericytochromatia bacterium]